MASILDTIKQAFSGSSPTVSPGYTTAVRARMDTSRVIRVVVGFTAVSAAIIYVARKVTTK